VSGHKCGVEVIHDEVDGLARAAESGNVQGFDVAEVRLSGCGRDCSRERSQSGRFVQEEFS